jgi:DNA polymerase III delta prime subunit
MPTILSRLPKLYFGLVTETEIESWLIKEQKLTKAKAAPYAARAMGKPGLAMRLLTDVDFRKKLETAEEYLTSPKTTRKDMIKKIIEPDDFNVRNFLEAVIMNLAWEKSSKAKAALWHRALELYGNVNNFGLNPRLQLEALLA